MSLISSQICYFVYMKKELLCYIYRENLLNFSNICIIFDCRPGPEAKNSAIFSR